MRNKKNITRRFIQVALSIILIAVILFAFAGRTDWFYAWIYIIATVLVVMTNASILPPELISERGRKKKNVKKWDRSISGLIMIPWLALYIISGLDARFVWSPVLASWIHFASLIIFILGNALVSWAMLSNIFFSTAVYIQFDRKHKVSKSGPYRYLRHPGYLGMIIFNSSTPLILGSVWALIPAILTIILFIIRTVFEDKTLKNKLEGYKEYSQKVKYRLIPGIW